MQSSVLVTLLIVCAVLLVVGGSLLLLAVVALALLLRTEEPARAGTPVFAGAPMPARPRSPSAEDFAGLDDEEVAKTEVFMRRGSMNLDWDGEDAEDATELVRADQIGEFEEQTEI